MEENIPVPDTSNAVVDLTMSSDEDEKKERPLRPLSEDNDVEIMVDTAGPSRGLVTESSRAKGSGTAAVTEDMEITGTVGQVCRGNWSICLIHEDESIRFPLGRFAGSTAPSSELHRVPDVPRLQYRKFNALHPGGEWVAVFSLSVIIHTTVNL